MRLLLLISVAAAAVSALALPAHTGGEGHMLAARANIHDGTVYTQLMYEAHLAEPGLSFDEASKKVFANGDLSHLSTGDARQVKKNWQRKHGSEFPSQQSYDDAVELKNSRSRDLYKELP